MKYPISNIEQKENIVNDYYLLPFKFERNVDGDEVIVNEIGDYLVVPEGTVEKITTKEIDKINDSELFNRLHSNFFISEIPLQNYLNILANRYTTKKSFLNDFTALHIIVMTLRCNQDCHYCQVSKVRKESSKHKFDINLKTLMKTIEFIFLSPSEHLTIEFQGGEPLIRFDLIKAAVEYAEQINISMRRKLTFVICTNLSYASKEILEYCKEHQVLISTSVDGPEIVHNNNRPNKQFNSYDKTISQIELARNTLGQDRVSALLTISKFSLSYPNKIIDEYIRLGFTEIFLRGLNPYGEAVKNKNEISYSVEEYVEFYKTALERIVEYNHKGIYCVEVFSKLVLTKMLSPFPMGFVDLQSPSGIINNVLLYNYDGNIYPSDEARMLAEMGDTHFHLGSVFNNYSEVIFNNTTSELASVWATEYIAGCSDCAFQSYCGIDPVRNYNLEKSIYGFRPNSDHCIKMKAIINYLIHKIENDKSFRLLAYKWTAN